MHPEIKRLHNFITKKLGFTVSDERWLSVHLGASKVIPRVYTTRAHTHELTWWHENNGLITDDNFGTNDKSYEGRYIEWREGAPDGFEYVGELTLPFINERTGLKGAVMIESYDPDTLFWRPVVVPMLERADKIAKYLGFGIDEVTPELVLPEETLVTQDFHSAALTLITEVSDTLLTQLRTSPENIHNITPREFEKLVARLLLDMGYQVWLTPEQKDGGRDILTISKQEVGTFLTLVECKKWRPDRPVPVEIVRAAYGVMQQQRASHALIVTTSRFTKDAMELRDALKYQLSLRDYDDINNWLARYK